MDKLIEETNKNEIHWNVSPEMFLFYERIDEKATLTLEKKEEFNKTIRIYTLRILSGNQEVYDIGEPIISFEHLCGRSGFGSSLFDRCPVCDGLKTPEKQSTLKLKELYKLVLNQIHNNYKKLISLLE